MALVSHQQEMKSEVNGRRRREWGENGLFKGGGDVSPLKRQSVPRSRGRNFDGSIFAPSPLFEFLLGCLQKIMSA